MKNTKELAIHGGIPVRDTFLNFHQAWLDKEEEEAIIDTLRSGWLTTGKKVKQFEEDFKIYTKSMYAVAVNSCTAALHLGLIAGGISTDDEVLTTPITFAATANVIVHQQAIPIFVDVEPQAQHQQI
jgi:dTDP-4-amino-4,6-dideoxygalactose transaminase